MRRGGAVHGTVCQQLQWLATFTDAPRSTEEVEVMPIPTWHNENQEVPSLCPELPQNPHTSTMQSHVAARNKWGRKNDALCGSAPVKAKPPSDEPGPGLRESDTLLICTGSEDFVLWYVCMYIFTHIFICLCISLDVHRCVCVCVC